MGQTRIAVVNDHSDQDVSHLIGKVSAYLPGNYYVVGAHEHMVIIAGVDVAGWTFDDYVQPRLASGLIFATELVRKDSV